MIGAGCWRHGVITSSSEKQGPGLPKVRDVRVSAEHLSVDLADGRTITVPLGWFPRLANASPAERDNWRVAGAGYGIHWPDIDEDVSVEGLLRRAPAPAGRSRTSGTR